MPLGFIAALLEPLPGIASTSAFESCGMFDTPDATSRCHVSSLRTVRSGMPRQTCLQQ